MNTEYNISENIIEIIIHLTSATIQSNTTKVNNNNKNIYTQTRRIDEEKQIDLDDFNAKHERLLSIHIYTTSHTYIYSHQNFKKQSQHTNSSIIIIIIYKFRAFHRIPDLLAIFHRFFFPRVYPVRVLFAQRF